MKSGPACLWFLVLLILFTLAACSGDKTGDAKTWSPDDSADDDDSDDRGPDNDFADDDDDRDRPDRPDYGAYEDAERLAQLAEDYQDWYENWHVVPPYGSLFDIKFTDPTNTEVYYYEGRWDSTLWTGVYAGTQCLRYEVTGDPEAQDNAIRALEALRHHKAVTGIPGFVARFLVPNIPYPYSHGHTNPDDPICHDGQGEYEGTRWCGNTSRDQYTGYWYAQSLCYDFLDDDETRQLISRDVREVVDYFIKNNWRIIRKDGTVSTAAGKINPLKQLDWMLIAAHILDDPELKHLYEVNFEKKFNLLGIDAFSFYNRYRDYYGNNLRWMTLFNLYRLETDPVRYDKYVNVMREWARPWIGWTHNPWTDLFWLYGCAGNYSCDSETELVDYIREDIAQFRPAPNRYLPVTGMPELPPDPFPIKWNQLVDRLIEAGLPEYLADELRFPDQPNQAQEVRFQCHADFVWQRSPFRNNCGDGDGSFVSSGVDYLAVYWLARWLKVLPGPEAE